MCEYGSLKSAEKNFSRKDVKAQEPLGRSWRRSQANFRILLVYVRVLYEILLYKAPFPLSSSNKVPVT
jgi:hypothetical protein